ncbi:MAG: hypothetical protein ACQ9MH_04440 [Nitrospinales bacterium]
MDNSSQWSTKEIEMINVVDVFNYKPTIIKKAEHNLTLLKNMLVAEISSNNDLIPEAADITKGQIAKGENNKGFPFISLDMPQQFSKTEMFTYRTLFWWGHYLGFSFIIKGENLQEYIDRLISRKETPTVADIYFSCNPSPWEWEWTDENFKAISITPEEEIRQVVNTIQYLKLCRFYPLNDSGFAELDWISAGLKEYNHMTKLFLHP